MRSSAKIELNELCVICAFFFGQLISLDSVALYFSDIQLRKVFSILRLPRHSSDGLPCCMEGFIFTKSWSLIDGLSACATGALFRQCLQVEANSLQLRTSGLVLRLLIHLRLSFVQSEREGSNYILQDEAYLPWLMWSF